MPSNPDSSYLDPAVLARISSLQVRARTVAEGFVSGLHHAPLKGSSLEFSEHREYAIGDELRNIDWKIYARSDRFFVKQYEQETNLRLSLVVDRSGSMGFRGSRSPMSKFDFAATAAASLAYLTLKQGDSVGLSTVHAEGAQAIPPRSHFAHLSALLETLQDARPSGETALARSLNDLVHGLKKRSLVIVFSDLLDDEDAVLNALKFFKYKKHEVVVVQLLDRDERELPYDGWVELESLEDGRKLTLQPDSFRREYREALTAMEERYRGALRKSGMEFYSHTTDEPLDRVLRFVLTHRSPAAAGS